MDPPDKWTVSLRGYLHEADRIRLVCRAGSGSKTEVGSWSIKAGSVEVLEDDESAYDEDVYLVRGPGAPKGANATPTQIADQMTSTAKEHYREERDRYRSLEKSLKQMDFWLHIQKGKEELCRPVYWKCTGDDIGEVYGADPIAPLEESKAAELGPAVFLLDRQAQVSTRMLDASGKREEALGRANIRMANATARLVEGMGDAQMVTIKMLERSGLAMEKGLQLEAVALAGGPVAPPPPPRDHKVEAFLGGLGQTLGASLGDLAGPIIKDLFDIDAKPEEKAEDEPRPTQARARMRRAADIIAENEGGWWDELAKTDPEAWEDLRRYMAETDHRDIDEIKAALEQLLKPLSTHKQAVMSTAPESFSIEMFAIHKLLTQ